MFLQFPVVFLPGLEDGLFPGKKAFDSMDGMEEERRLAYVGITRAKEDLTITCAKSRMIRGETQVFPVSRFVKEIPQSLLDHKIDEKKPKEFMDYPFTGFRFNLLWISIICCLENENAGLV